MFTFSNGLVLRRGERTLEFHRRLGPEKIQFAYQDDGEINTYTESNLYAKILNGEIKVVHQNGKPVLLPNQVQPDGAEAQPYSVTLTPDDEGRISRCMRYVRDALQAGATTGSLKKCEKSSRETSERIKDESPPSGRTLKSWLGKFLRSGGNPFVFADRRAYVQRSKRISDVVEEAIKYCVEKYYLQRHGISMRATHQRVKEHLKSLARMRGEVIPTPSLKTIERRIDGVNFYIRDMRRYGKAYAQKKWRYSLAGDQSTRILERVEIDHTCLDIWVLDPRSGVPIGRPWITVAIDRYSGYILGLHVSFYGPSVGSVAQTIRNALMPKDDLLSALPSIQVMWTAKGVAELYVVDNGLEFHAAAFRNLAWYLRADLLYNKVRQPWLKAGIERAMLEVNRMLPLQGKVYFPVKNMEVIDPKKTAAILFDDLCEGLVQWAADQFPRQIHPKTLIRPIDLWEEGLQSSPLPMFPVNLDEFEIQSGVAMHRTVAGDGIFFNYLRYNSVELQDYCRRFNRKFRSEVRFNPDNLEKLHILLPEEKRWLQVPLTRPTADYGRGLSLIQHQIYRKEAGSKLTALNAEEELYQAQLRTNARWGEAIARGVKVRKDADLIRIQALTSASVVKEKLNSAVTPEAPPPQEQSKHHKMIEKLMPFDSFSLDEEIL